MKKILISIFVSIFIMFVIPILVVSLIAPHENAASTEPATPTEAVGESSV